MNRSRQARQGELFTSSVALGAGSVAGQDWPLLRRHLEDWQTALRRHQGPLFAAGADRSADQPLQGALFETGCPARTQAAEGIHPLQLRAQPLSFWRWPDPPQRGAALYFVLDGVTLEAAHDPQPVLLYVGETGRADRRWKAEHDCKHYLAAYSEALARAGLASRLNIRFWLDAPSCARERRALEQALIRRWLPPFNKETRQRWATPFTAEPD